MGTWTDGALQVETAAEHDIPCYHGSAFLHLLKKHRIPNDPARVSNLATRLRQPCDGLHNGAFLHIRQFGDLDERLPKVRSAKGA
jgi:hypothetical protein